MCKLPIHKHLDRILISNEKRTWIDFWLLAAYFLGSNKADNHKELVEMLVLPFPKLDCNICSKISFLYNHQDVCPEIFEAVNEEHGSCFHHDISAVENT
jgi:hypothetical protein